MQKLLHIVALVLVAAIAYCLLVRQEFPVLHDFPEWMYQGWLFAELSSGQPSVSERFQLVAYPVPNSISQVAMGLLNLVTTPVMAGRIWLGLYFVVASILWLTISRHDQNGDDGARHLLLTVLVTLGPGFWNGYINFQFGLLFFAIYLYTAHLRQLNSKGLLLLFSLLIFFSHAAVFAAFILVHLSTLLFIPSKRRLSGLVVLIPSVLLLGWYSMVKLAEDNSMLSQRMGIAEWLQYKVYTLAKQGPFHNFIEHDGSSYLESFNAVYKVGFAVNFVVALLFVCWFVYLVWLLFCGRLTAGFRTDISRLVPITLCAALLLVAYLVLGKNTLGVVNPGERFLIAGLLVFLMFYRTPKFLRLGLTGCCAVVSVYLVIAMLQLSSQSPVAYSVARSADSRNLQQYVGDIYANSSHKYFNHRLYIYADRGIELTREKPALLEIDLATSVVRNLK